MFNFILAIHILISIVLVTLILLQHGKGADAGAAFGSSTTGSIFGSVGANSFVYNLTKVVATIFFTTSLVLTYLATNDTRLEDAGIISNSIPAVSDAVLSDGLDEVPSDIPQ
jgi:preprotein translocase subunit SecG